MNAPALPLLPNDTPQPSSSGHDDTMERGLLGAILVASLAAKTNEAFEQASHLKAEDFLSKPARYVYRAMERLHARGVLIDLGMVRQELKDVSTERVKAYEDVGEAYLAELMLAEGLNIAEYARAVSYASLRQTGRLLAREIEKAVANTSKPLPEAAEHLLASVQAFVTRVHALTGQTGVNVGDSALAFLKTLRHNLANDITTTGISTGLKALDDLIIGLRRKLLILVAGRASMGKTAVLLHMARAAHMVGERVIFITLEQPEEELMSRLMAIEADVDGMRLQALTLNEEELSRLESAAYTIAKRNERAAFIIVPMTNPSMDEIHAVLKAYSLAPGFDLVLVDYAGPTMIRNDHPKRDDRQHMSWVAAKFKAMAKEFNVPFPVGAQLNRAAASAERPKKEHLAESGGLENAADIVLLLWRDTDMKPVNGIQPMEVIVDKHRNGRIGMAQVDYVTYSTRIENASAIMVPFGDRS